MFDVEFIVSWSLFSLVLMYKLQMTSTNCIVQCFGPFIYFFPEIKVEGKVPVSSYISSGRF